MYREPVVSESIAGIGYDHDAELLEVEFVTALSIATAACPRTCTKTSARHHQRARSSTSTSRTRIHGSRWY